MTIHPINHIFDFRPGVHRDETESLGAAVVILQDTHRLDAIP